MGGARDTTDIFNAQYGCTGAHSAYIGTTPGPAVGSGPPGRVAAAQARWLVGARGASGCDAVQQGVGMHGCLLHEGAAG
jgi:hypothetical protein